MRMAVYAIQAGNLPTSTLQRDSCLVILPGLPTHVNVKRWPSHEELSAKQLWC